TPVQLAYERRNRDLDPQLVWRGKDEQDWSDLIVQAPPPYIQEKVHPKVIIDLKRASSLAQRGRGTAEGGGGGAPSGAHARATSPAGGGGLQPDLFAEFNGLR